MIRGVETGIFSRGLVDLNGWYVLLVGYGCEWALWRVCMCVCVCVCVCVQTVS